MCRDGVRLKRSIHQIYARAPTLISRRTHTYNFLCNLERIDSTITYRNEFQTETYIKTRS